MSTSSNTRGMVFDIQRMSIHDGPGIRTSVFLKGCPLQCPWCHNPEGINPAPDLFFIPALCIRCGGCVKRCPNHAHLIQQHQHEFDRAKCARCFSCVEACPTGALEKVGTEMTAEEVLAEVEKDIPFYEESGGGMTLTGGEPMTQLAFVVELLQGARSRGIHTCVETSGFAPKEHFEKTASLTDLVLFDIKETDPERHARYTGVSLQPIQQNLRHVAKLGIPIILRCVIIPEINLREDYLFSAAELAKTLKTCQGIELLPYHSWGENKRLRLGHPPDPFSEVSEDQKDSVLDFLRMCGVEHVCWV